jgi:hypothetical protein
MKTVSSSLLLVAIMFASSTTSAHAYIDPVTGSFVIQGIAAGFAGAMVAFRSLRQRVFGLLRVKKSNDGPTASPGRDS